MEPSFNDFESVRKVIYEFYAFAEVSPTNYDGTVNDEVVRVFTQIYTETVKCSDALALVPRPPSGPASLIWLATQLGGAAFRGIKGKLNQTCARAVLLKHMTPMLEGSKGFASLVHPLWA